MNNAAHVKRYDANIPQETNNHCMPGSDQLSPDTLRTTNHDNVLGTDHLTYNVVHMTVDPVRHNPASTIYTHDTNTTIKPPRTKSASTWQKEGRCNVVTLEITR